MTIFNILLFAHISSGFISLLLGTLVLTFKKADQLHRKLGRIYYYSMLTACLCAIPMTYLRPNPFLFTISIFTLYMLISGKRYLGKAKNAEISRWDWTLTIAITLFGLIFIGIGVWQVLKSDLFGTVFLTFGIIGLSFAAQDRRLFLQVSSLKSQAITTHLQRMMGSYIASTTAFLVVNNTLLPGAVAWLLPTAIITPLIIIYTQKYKTNALPK